MIEKSCKTCERGGGGCGLSDCHAPDWSHHFASRAALEARIAALEDVARKLAAEATRSINDVIAKAIEARIEREAARAEVERLNGELRDLRTALDVEVAHAREEASASVARMESELGGLRHSLAEVEAELEGERSARCAFAGMANVLEDERDRLREELGAMLAVIDGNRSCHYGIEANRKFRESVVRLRALLGKAKEGGGA